MLSPDDGGEKDEFCHAIPLHKEQADSDADFATRTGQYVLNQHFGGTIGKSGFHNDPDVSRFNDAYRGKPL